MGRPTSSLGDLARSVLDAVERDSLGKSAAATYTSSRTEVGEGLRKIASELRTHKPSEVTYEDLEQFRNRHGL